MTPKKSYKTHLTIFLSLGTALALFVYLLVDHHRSIPDAIAEQRQPLLGDNTTMADRIKPYGDVNVAGAQTDAPVQVVAVAEAATKRDGQQVYKEVCVTCHGAGIAGAPKVGDKTQWAKRIAKGKDALYTSALKGKQGSAGVMPPKGGNPGLSDAEVKSAVDFMTAQSK
ncbi:MAG: cytochrome c5 family protein [Gammaproteobacteria bacterium]|nr:cytochrome c5 family protein [Gammaproteobacteria bacterium]